jgi:hypothetical protein
MNVRSCWKIAAPAAALGLLAACTTATPYQPLGATNVRGGYTNQQLDATHWRVNFVGNSLTSREQVENYLLFRAAELTLQQNSTCFTIVSRDTDRDVRVQVDPYGPYGGYGGYGGFGRFGGYYPGWSPSWRMFGPWGSYYYDPWLGGPFMPRQYDVRTISSYQATADIALGSGACQTTAGTFNAAQVVQNLRPYIVYPRAR